MLASDTNPPAGLEIRFGRSGRVLSVPDAWIAQARHIGHRVVREPLRRQTWRELAYFMVSGILGGAGLVLLLAIMLAGTGLVVTVVGVAVIGLALRFARGLGRWDRALARRLGVADVAEPEPFAPGHGFFGWVQSAVRDRVAWRATAYSVLKAALWLFGTWFAFSLWFDAAVCLLFPVHFISTQPTHVFGIVRAIFPPGYLSVGSSGFVHGAFVFVTGILFVFLAPWPMRAVVGADRWLLQTLLSPDPLTARIRTLEVARSQTIDTSAATLRRIERDLHDGTQAQLVALAMQLGQAKEKLAGPGALGAIDLDGARRLVDDAHRGTKEAIAELRDLVRGIHPPVLDTGLEGALATLVARSSVPTRLDVALVDRPSPAIEAIAYFCAAELLANVAQHASATRAVVSCVQEGTRLRLVVSDDGTGGAAVSLGGASSSGLAGLSERVHAVDGHLHVASPPGGPTTVAVGLPIRT
jgi:signal transduction histidine kinase